MKIVIVQECSAGNAEVGDMWLETGIFEDTQTIKEVLEWKNKMPSTNGRTIITVPKEEK